MREMGVDLARGSAVLSMFVAHVAPGGGAIMLSEFLTAPLFALLITLSLVLSWERRLVGPGRWYAIQFLRGATLVGLASIRGAAGLSGGQDDLVGPGRFRA